MAKKNAPVALPEPPKFTRHICADGDKITVKSESVATKREYAKTSYLSGGFSEHVIDIPVNRFAGSIEEAREFHAALGNAIQDATRLEGAVASIYATK